jgi:hypothetical protein
LDEAITFKCKVRQRKLRKGAVVYSHENVKVEIKVMESEAERGRLCYSTLLAFFAPLPLLFFLALLLPLLCFLQGEICRGRGGRAGDRGRRDRWQWWVVK